MHLKPIRYDGFLTNKLPKIATLIGILGLIGCLISFKLDSHHFFFSYLTSFMFYLSLSLGALFFVLMQFLSRAGWGVVVRRIPEIMMMGVIPLALCFLPILAGMHDLFHWTHEADVAKDHLLQVKAPYLNIKFFVIRAILFFAIWIFLVKKLFACSTKQDDSGDETLTLKAQKTSTYGILLFALSLTFAGIDWVMSLTPHWYSTMFGVYLFAGAVVGSLCVLSLILIILKKLGYLKDIVTVEHFHDLGKLIYGFNIFWAYVAFSQYFLIWYANIPEETAWFASHFNGSWNSVAVLLCVGHFGVPFILFMSRHIKRNTTYFTAMLIWILCMHFVDVYWIIMPTASKSGIHFSLADISAFVGIGGIWIAYICLILKKVSLIPNKDPRLSQSVGHTVG